MIPCRPILVAISVLCLAPAAIAFDPPEGDEPPARVIIRVNRHEEVRGHVELEDRDIIVIRGPGGSVQSFTKSRVAAIVRLVEPKPGQEGVVILRNGQRRRGVIIEDTFDHVTIEVEGIRSKLVRDVVDYVVLEPTFEERYAQYKKTLKANQPQLHLELCRWLLTERHYELARQELEALLADNELAEARRLLKIVEAQIALLPGTPPVSTRPAPDDRPERHVELADENLLTHEDVNLIRVYEIDFVHPPKVVVRPETVRALIEGYGTTKLIPTDPRERAALYRADPLEIVRLLFELRARELYPQVEVVNEPRALNLFRQRVHNAWLVKNCATSRCHSGPEPGRFFLHRQRYKDERVRYTNLLLLERLEVDPIWPLVNYEEPSMSLVIQYGLPRHLARKPHPDVKGWKPVFNNLNSRLLRESVGWIEAMMRPRPAYPVQLELPPASGPGTPETPPTGR